MHARCYEAPSWGRCVVPPFGLPCSIGWDGSVYLELAPICPRYPGDARPALLADLVALVELTHYPLWWRAGYVRDARAHVAVEVP